MHSAYGTLKKNEGISEDCEWLFNTAFDSEHYHPDTVIITRSTLNIYDLCL